MKNKIFIAVFIFYGFQAFSQDKKLVDILSKYTRPVTVLIIKEQGISFAAKLAGSVNGVVVLLDSQAKKNRLAERKQNLVVLQKSWSISELQTLSECEHFDIAYIDDFPEEKLRRQFLIFSRLAEHVLLKCSQHTILSSSFGFTQLENSPLFYKSSCIKFLYRTNWLQESNPQNEVREIVSSYEKKVQIKKHEDPLKEINWVPGINLMTLKHLNGIIPSPQSIQRQILKLWEVPHTDWMPNNMIVQGKKLALIDFDNNPEVKPKTVKTDTMLALMLKYARESDADASDEIYHQMLDYNQSQIHSFGENSQDTCAQRQEDYL